MTELETALRDRWARQMARLGWQAGDSQINGIITAYSEPHRRYHGLSHLVHIFNELDRWETELATPQRCWMAAWYHDIIYDPKGAENETLSAKRAARELPQLGAPVALVKDVSTLILATADHQSGGRDRDDALFLDIDFSILGAPAEIYDKYRPRASSKRPARAAAMVSSPACLPAAFPGPVGLGASEACRAGGCFSGRQGTMV